MEHGWAIGHTIRFDKIEILYKSEQWGPRTTRESLELLLVDNALNREEGTRLSDSWLPACEFIKSKRLTDSEEA